MPKMNNHTTAVYFVMMILTILKMLGLSDLAAGLSSALCYYLLWRG